MADVDLPGPPPAASRPPLPIRLAASRAVQRWAARTPVLRRFVRAEGEALFDLVAGFCHSQVLFALVKLDIPRLCLDAPRDTDALSRLTQLPQDRMRLLLRAGAALRLLRQRRDGRWQVTTRGAALATVPGLQGMIAHHDVLYRDLADPVAFLRGDTETELAAFWPYVFGAGGATDPDLAARYSALMADSQTLVAEDTLDLVDLGGAREVLDVGGGTGAFLTALGARHPGPRLTLFDLPAVAPAATRRFGAAGMAGRARIVTGSFRDDPLPRGADTITLIRVLYDHADATVAALLSAAFAALPPGGRLVVSEPMAGHRATDVYFALYCAAMRTGQVRSAAEIAALLGDAGFVRIGPVVSRRPFVTSVISAVKPD